jgi:hypothetical protein
MKALLLIACSNRKVKTQKLIPALERYDGGTYRVIRKMQREIGFPRNVEIKIVSAKLGLIDASERIPYYDQRMNKQRAKELGPKVHKELRKYIAKNRISEIYIDLGSDYLPVIENLIVPSKIELLMAQGRIGERLRLLKEWLFLMKG